MYVFSGEDERVNGAGAVGGKGVFGGVVVRFLLEDSSVETVKRRY